MIFYIDLKKKTIASTFNKWLKNPFKFAHIPAHQAHTHILHVDTSRKCIKLLLPSIPSQNHRKNGDSSSCWRGVGL